MFKSLIVRKFNIQTFKHLNSQTYLYNKKQLNLRMEKIKVLHITQAFGGVETYLRQVVQNIDKEKYEIIIASPEKDTLQKFCADNNVKHYVLHMSRGINLPGDIGSIFRIRG